MLKQLSRHSGNAPGFRHGTAMASIAALFASPAAYAAGTVAGTDIQNIATASYETGGNTVQVQSNTVTIRVDELLDVTVGSTDPGDIPTSNGATSVVSTFRVTNTGNGSEAFLLTPNVANGGDDFDPTLVQVVLDTNGNGVYDPGVDTVYTPGVNDPVLAPDQNIVVFVLTNIPGTQDDGDRAEVRLTAVARTGTGAPGTTFPGQGQGGGNAVVGATGADDTASGFLAIQAAALALVKSATVVDPFGGTTIVPGSVVTYTLVATISGTGTLANVAITDPIPAGSQYVASSMTLQAAALTDAVDADAGNYNGTRVAVSLGNLPSGQIRTVTFKVRVQ